MVWLVILIVTNVVWIIQDQSPPIWDIAGHSYRSAYNTHLAIEGQFKNMLIDQDTHYPPFAYLATGVFYLIFGYHSDIPQFSLLIYIVILQFSVFAVAKIFTRSNAAALFACILASLLPLVAHFSRIYDLDYPLMAMFMLSFFLLLKTEFFSHAETSLLFGLVAALGFLTKFMFPAFLVPLVLVYLVYYGISKRKNHGPPLAEVFRNIGWALLIFILLTGPWYYFHYQTILAVGQETNMNEFFVKFADLFSWNNFVYYFLTLSAGVGWPIMIIFVLACLFLAYKYRKKFLFLFLSALLSYLFLTFYLYAKESRYLLPIYPLVAIIITAFIFKLPFKRIKIGLAILTLLIALTFWMQTSWNVKFLKTDFGNWPSFFRVYGMRQVKDKDPQFGFTYPTQYNTELPQLVDKIIADKSGQEKTIQIAVVPNSIFLSSNQIQFFGELKNLKAEYELSRQLRVGDYQEVLLKADYVITKTGDQGPEPWALKAYDVAEEEAQEAPNFFTENFEVMYEYFYGGIESEEYIKLYKRK